MAKAPAGPAERADRPRRAAGCVAARAPRRDRGPGRARSSRAPSRTAPGVMAAASSAGDRSSCLGDLGHELADRVGKAVDRLLLDLLDGCLDHSFGPVAELVLEQLLGHAGDALEVRVEK